jgi:hypothetical protein
LEKGREEPKNKGLKDKDFSKLPKPAISKSLTRIKQKTGNRI